MNNSFYKDQNIFQEQEETDLNSKYQNYYVPTIPSRKL
jgi:hypothetical protein